MLSIFSHSSIVLLFWRGIRAEGGSDMNQIGPLRNHTMVATLSTMRKHFRLKQNPEELYHFLNKTMSNLYRRDGPRLLLNPLSLESHSSKLNQSRLFDSIQTPSQAEEGRGKSKAENEST